VRMRAADGGAEAANKLPLEHKLTWKDIIDP
jgi:hypothetical protein